MKTKFIAMVALLLSLVMLAAGAETVEQSTDIPEASTEVEGVMPEMPDAYLNGSIVLTPVGELKLPEEWNDIILAEEMIPTEENSCYSVTWYTMMDEVRYDLFRVYLGESDFGFYFGNAMDAEGNLLGIYVEVIVPEPAMESESELTAEQDEELGMMRECVNYIIEQIYSLPSMERMD